MVQINFAKKEVSCKLVYYGPGLSGKTTNLEIIYQKAPEKNKGKMTSVATEGDRTLFFDFLPLDIGKVGGMNTKFQLYTVPGQVYYNSTRKLVLQGVDGVIFVAHSEKDKMAENIESLKNLEENLNEQGIKIAEIPLVLQYNKRDLPDLATVEELDKTLNKWNVPSKEAVAFKGDGVFPTLKLLAAVVLDRLNRKYGVKKSPAKKTVAEINGDKIPMSDFDRFCVIRYRLSGRREPPGGVRFTRAEKEKYLHIFVNNILAKMAAKEQGISAGEPELKAQVEKAVSRFGSREKFIQYLKGRKLTEEDYTEEAGTRILANKLLAQMVPDYKQKIAPNEDQLKEIFEKDRKKFPDPFDREKKRVMAQARKINKRKMTEQMFQEIRKEAEINTFL